MSAVWLHPEGFDPERRFLVVPGVEEREWYDPELESRVMGSRVVPASLPDFTVTCPECDGGTRDLGPLWQDPVFGQYCARCGGEGTVSQLLHAEKQCRAWVDGRWMPWVFDDPSSEWADMRIERRQAILAATGVRPLPVVEYPSCPELDHIEVSQPRAPRHVTLWRWTGSEYDDNPEALTGDPLFADLRPGDTVLELTGEVRWLDEPTTEIVRLDIDTEGFYCGPLALVPGLQQIDLER